jgi:hypothetical protein
VGMHTEEKFYRKQRGLSSSRHCTEGCHPLSIAGFLQSFHTALKHPSRDEPGRHIEMHGMELHSLAAEHLLSTAVVFHAASSSLLQ